MRVLKSAAPSLAALRETGATVVLADLRLRVVTPMFGGGVDPGEVDGTQPIRPSAIRGHLRFWWRACNAARFEKLEELHEEERRIWGSATKEDDPTTGPGAIAIRVVPHGNPGERFTNQKVQVRRRDGTIRDKWIWRREGDPTENELGPDYALFPFTPQPTATPPRAHALPGLVNVEFRLSLTLAAHVTAKTTPSIVESREAARQALWAWITFGGVGSRTRRGCGTVACLADWNAPSDPVGEWQLRAEAFQAPATVAELKRWMVNHLHQKGTESVVTGTAPRRGVPSLVGCRISVENLENSSITAWNSAVQTMQEFLQGPGIARNPARGGRPGESWWPEVSAAREILDRPDPPHAIAAAGAKDRNNFPRADLGLPRLIKVTANDRHGTPLQGSREGLQRLASPIILKALPAGNGGYALALELDAPHVWDPSTPGVSMDDVAVSVAPMTVTSPDWPFGPGNLPPRVAAPPPESARDAFMAYLKNDCGWEEVIP